jgi:hypothetical protein
VRYRIAAAAFVTAWILFGLRLFLRRRTSVTAAGALCLAAALALGISAAVTYREERLHPPAVIVAPQIAVYQSDYEDAELLFTEKVHAGTEVRIVEDRGPWIRVEFPNGKDGWIKRVDEEADPSRRPTIERV